VNETPCENCRIAISEEGIEVDSSSGDIVAEAIIISGLLVLLCAVYAFKKWIDRKFK
tara:strand:+ start:4669 stop:4839 length:171 start_codon:yes stop_codon:yes gene_type:complete